MMAPTVDPIAYLRSFGFLSPEEAARLDTLAQSKWFLVRIDGAGERWKCGHCGGRHAHFTKFCIEKPWRGLEGALYGYWTNVGAGDPRTLSPRQALRVRQIGKALGLPPQMNLSTLHPQAARALGGDDADTDIGANVLGTLDEITESKARLLADLINARARRPIIVL